MGSMWIAPQPFDQDPLWIEPGGMLQVRKRSLVVVVVAVEDRARQVVVRIPRIPLDAPVDPRQPVGVRAVAMSRLRREQGRAERGYQVSEGDGGLPHGRMIPRSIIRRAA